MLQIEYVIFDAVGTLLFPAVSVAESYAETGVRHGSCITPSEIGTRLRLAMESANNSRVSLATSESLERDFWRRVVCSIFHDVSSAACRDILDELWNYFATAAAWQLFDDAAETLRTLRENDVKVGIGSNFDHRLHTVCDGLSITEFVDRIFDSASVGFCKPSEHFFHHLQAKIGLEPCRLLMVGDSLDADIHGALRCDWNAILIDRDGSNDAGGHMLIRSLTHLPALLAPKA